MSITLLVSLLLNPVVMYDDKHVESANPQGRYGKFDEGSGAAAHVWYDDSGWHMRFRGQAKPAATFQGKVYLDKEIPQIKGGQKEKNDKLKRITNGFSFDYKTAGKGFDAIDFYVPQDATRVTFEIKVIGNDDPKHIYLGSKGAHPKTAIFSFPAHPDKK